MSHLLKSGSALEKSLTQAQSEITLLQTELETYNNYAMKGHKHYGGLRKCCKKESEVIKQIESHDKTNFE